MNTNNAVRRALALDLGLPWRQVRFRVSHEGRFAGAAGRFEVECGGRWQPPPEGWPLSFPSRRVPDWLLNQSLRAAARHRHLPARLMSGVDGFDQCCGGGMLRGSVLVVSSLPGAGKTALALAVAHGLASRSARVLYASSEEGLLALSSKLRALGLSRQDDLALLASTSWVDIEAEADRLEPDVVFVDAVNTVALASDHDDPRHSLMVAKAAARMTRHAAWRPTVVLLSHTKRDTIDAGPSHEADTVLHLRRQGDVLVVRTWKNRHGPDDVEARYVFRDGRLRGAPSDDSRAERPA